MLRVLLEAPWRGSNEKPQYVLMMKSRKFPPSYHKILLLKKYSDLHIFKHKYMLELQDINFYFHGFYGCIMPAKHS